MGDNHKYSHTHKLCFVSHQLQNMEIEKRQRGYRCIIQSVRMMNENVTLYISHEKTTESLIDKTVHDEGMNVRVMGS